EGVGAGEPTHVTATHLLAYLVGEGERIYVRPLPRLGASAKNDGLADPDLSRASPPAAGRVQRRRGSCRGELTFNNVAGAWVGKDLLFPNWPIGGRDIPIKQRQIFKLGLGAKGISLNV